MFTDARAHRVFAMSARQYRVMEPFRPDGEKPTIGRREHSRLRVRLPARLTTLDGTTSAVLTDLSYGGAKLVTGCELRPGQQAVLAWSAFEAFGTVSWVHDGMCGMHFEEFLDGQVLLATRDLDDTGHLPSDRDLTRGAARDFVRGVRRW
jgi:hypothetical protein